jgi:hypothetical protein
MANESSFGAGPARGELVAKEGEQGQCRVVGGELPPAVGAAEARREIYCGVPLIFGELCRMIDFYVGNEYVLINRRFSEYARFISNY